MTSFQSVYLRYLVIYQLYGGKKDNSILGSLIKIKFLPKEWYLKNINYVTANTREIQLIDSYAASHGEKYPPGNTFRG